MVRKHCGTVLQKSQTIVTAKCYHSLVFDTTASSWVRLPGKLKRASVNVKSAELTDLLSRISSGTWLQTLCNVQLCRTN